MVKRRATNTVSALPSKEEAVAQHQKYAEAYYELKAQEAEMEQRLAAIREEYSPRFTQLKAAMDASGKVVQVWAEANKHNFDLVRTESWAHAAVGFRTHPPKVSVIRGRKDDDGKAWTMKKALESIVSHDDAAYFSREVKLNKSAILEGYRDNPAKIQEDIAVYGLEIKQDEAFFIEVKEEDIS
ncbi:host-nuclease inhibitor Gam family protein [Algivirga pacifica]|uniref:Mu-like prophage host-nuclease inhibitor protein Gam n=1 Tax=Algivirga pacifica TaxID=1162670 RepID=A0ABP9D2G7_9BACT